MNSCFTKGTHNRPLKNDARKMRALLSGGVRSPMQRASMTSFALLLVSVGLAVLVCMRLFGRLDANSFLVAVATGSVCSALWFFGSFLPHRIAPSPGVSGFLASFVPALFIPDAFFLGVGVVFIAACTLAGILFSAALWLVAKRASNKPLNVIAPKDGAPR